MWKQRSTRLGVIFSLIILLVVAFLVHSSLRQPEKIVLPAESDSAEPGDSTGEGGEVIRIEIRPDTVQSVIEALRRPAVYSRTITVERYWDGGSGAGTIAVRAADGWLRLDADASNGQTRHVITGEGQTYIWYGSSRKYFAGSASFSQDVEQGILTYEDILRLPPEQIAAADYRSLENVNCIYVETAEDALGYVERYWVSVDSGLLTGAERLCSGEVVYRMAALSVSYDDVEADAFTLPDNTMLYEPTVAEKENEKETG